MYLELHAYPNISFFDKCVCMTLTLFLCRQYGSLEDQGGEEREKSDRQHTASPGFQVCTPDQTDTNTHTHTHTHARARGQSLSLTRAHAETERERERNSKFLQYPIIRVF